MIERAQLPDSRLDRKSFVPLYHQLHDVLKGYIEAGRWKPGNLMPSEPELCRHFVVSRMVVRQALAMLEDDGRVIRHRGRGTFVAEARVEHRAGGLIRLLQAPRQAGLVVTVLDDSLQKVEGSIHEHLGVSTSVRRITTQLSLAETPIAVSYSHLDPERSTWLEAISAGAAILPRINAERSEVRLGRSDVSVEGAACGRFEASHLGIPDGSPVFSVVIADFEEGDEGGHPLEIAHARYRGEPLRCRLELSPGPVRTVIASFAFGNSLSNV